MKAALTLAWGIMKPLLIVGGLVFWVWAAIWISHQRRNATITGYVVDAQSGQPVPNAKVVVSTWYYGLFSNPTNYGTLTDGQGEFRIRVSPGYWIAWIDVAASTPDNKYAFQGKIRRDYVPIAANHLVFHQLEIESFHYDTFNGGWSGKVNWQK
jgi:hypothetical protein